ncbi:MAG: hypothetical protein ACKV0T_21690 [Planctomycetales bacterium]
MNIGSEVAILNRIIEPEKPELPVDLAKVILGWQFSESDRRRMQELISAAKQKQLRGREKADAENYERIGHFLSILKSKARRSLKRQPSR